MKSLFFWCAGLGLAALAGSVAAQGDLSPGKHRVSFGAEPAASPSTKSSCGVDPGDVLLVQGLGSTGLDPEQLAEHLVAQSDDCTLRITYGGGDDYGIEVELHQSTPVPSTRDVHVKTQYLGDGQPQMELLAKRAGFDFVLIDTLDADPTGKIDEVVTIQNLPIYYHSSSSSIILHLKGRITLGFFAGGLPCKDDYAVDRVD